jgi:hypothetical protein
MKPFKKLLEVWSTIEGAPQIVPWVPVTTDSDMIYFLTNILDQYPGMHFNFLDKPLFLVTNNIWALDDTIQLSMLKSEYTIRRMWGLFWEPRERWSFLQTCISGFKGSQGTQKCDQKVTIRDGSIEQISVTVAYQETLMSDKRTAVPKFQGRTLRQQFETVLNNPGIPIVIFTGWNEWIAQRFCLDANYSLTHLNCNETNDHFPDGSKIFVDLYDIEYNRDIEPGKNEMGDYYYQLMKSCIDMYRTGNSCDTASNELYCRDYDVLVSIMHNPDIPDDIGEAWATQYPHE